MIVGTKVRLRPPEEGRGDHELIVAWRREPEIRRSFFGEQEITLESHLAWYRRIAADDGQMYLVIEALLDPESAESLLDPIVIGTVGLSNIDGHNRTAEFGRFMIGDARFRGAGCGREAACLVCEHAFGALHLNRLWAEVIAGNQRALGLYESIGFKQEGVLREHVFKGGRHLDVVRVGMLAAGFVSRDAKLERSPGLGRHTPASP